MTAAMRACLLFRCDLNGTGRATLAHKPGGDSMVTKLPGVFDLHEMAQKAMRNENYLRAAVLYRQAAEIALTPQGAEVLLDLARDATNRAERQQQTRQNSEVRS